MLKIGEFSKLSRVSIRMLRYYDDIGLIKCDFSLLPILPSYTIYVAIY